MRNGQQHTVPASHSTAALLPDLHNPDSAFPSFELLNGNGVYSLGGLRVAAEAYPLEDGDFRPELQEFHARLKERLVQSHLVKMQDGRAGNFNLGLPSSHLQFPVEAHRPVSNAHVCSNQAIERAQMQMPSSLDETAEVHDFFEPTQITQEQATSASVPHLPWLGMNSRNDQTERGYQMPYKSEAPNARNWIGNRLRNHESSNHLSFQSSSGISSQPANNDASLKVTHSFLAASGKQSSESERFSNKGISLQSFQSSSNPTVIRSQPRSQPLNFEGLFSSSATQFEKGDASSVEKERVDESRPRGQNVMYNHVQHMKSSGLNQEVMPQEQPSQNYDVLGGQLFPKANLQGGFGQQPEFETAQYWQQHILYQQYIQEMHRQQLILQLQQHSQLSGQQQLQLLLASHNQGFSTQFSQEQDHLKAGAESWQSPYQPYLYQPQNASSNVQWPLTSLSSMQGDTKSLPPGAGISWQQLAPKASPVNSPLINYSYKNRRDDGIVQTANTLPNAQADTDYHYGGIEKQTIDGPMVNRQASYDPNIGPPAYLGVSLGRNSSYDDSQRDKLQLSGEFPFGQIAQDTCLQSANEAKNMNSYYDNDLQSSSQLVDYSTRQQNWAGVGHEGETQVSFFPQSNPRDSSQSSMLGSHFESQEIYEKINSPQSCSELLLGNQSKDLQKVRSHSTGADTLNKTTMKQGSWSVQGMHNLSPRHDEAMNSTHMELGGSNSWSNVQMQETQFQSGNSHQPGPGIKEQGVWNDLSLQNGSPLSGSTLRLFTDFDGRQSVDGSEYNLQQHNSQIVSKSEDEQQFSESRLLQEQNSLQTENSFPLADSTERLHVNWKASSLHQSDVYLDNKLQALLELEEKMNDQLPNQQLFQDATQNGGPFQLTEMDWQNQSRSWDQSLQHAGLHGQAFLPINHSIGRVSKAEIRQRQGHISQNMQLFSKVDSPFQNNEDGFASAGISQSHAAGLEGRTQIVQVADRMQAENFQLSREVIAKRSRGQADVNVQNHSSDMGTNLEAFGVDVRSKERMLNTQNPMCVSQELPLKLWANQNATSKQEFNPQFWRLLLSNAVDNVSGRNQRDGSMFSTISQGGNNADYPQVEQQDDREKLMNMKCSLLESPQKDRYSHSPSDSHAKLQHRLHSPNLSGSVGGSTPPRLSLLSGNLVSSCYNPEVSSAENINFDERLRPETDVQQLLAQQNGQKSITGKQVHYAIGPSQIKEKATSVRTEITPEANQFGYVSGNDPAADPLVFVGVQNSSTVASYSSMSRNTLQLLNKPESLESTSPQMAINQQPIMGPQIESGAISHNVYLSQNRQKQPMSPQHFGLRLGQPSHMVPLTKNGRSSLLSRSSNVDDGSVWPGKESHRHRLPAASCNGASSKDGETRLAQMDLSGEISSHDVTHVFQSMAVTPSPFLQSPEVTNELRNHRIGPAQSAAQFFSASVSHPSPYLDSADHQSFDFASQRGCAEESTFMERPSANSSSNLESNLESNVPISVASQDHISQKKIDAAGSMHQPRLLNDARFSKLLNNFKNSLSGQQRHTLAAEKQFPGVFESFRAPLPRREGTLQLSSMHEKSTQSTREIERRMNSQSSAHLDPRENPITVGHADHASSSRIDKWSNDRAADYSGGNAFKQPMAHLKAREEVQPSALQGHTRMSAMQENTSSVNTVAHMVPSKVQMKMVEQAHLSCMAGEARALQVVQQHMNSQSKNLIQRPLNVGQEVPDLHTASHVDSAPTKKQHSSISGNSEEGGKNLGSIEDEYSFLKGSNQHDAQDPRPQVAPLAGVRKYQHSGPTSMASPFKRPRHGPTMFSDQRLGSGASFIQNKAESQGHSHSPSQSLPKSLYESAQKHSQRQMYAEGALPSGYSERNQNSSLLKQQAPVLLSSSLAVSGHLVEQSFAVLQPSESVGGQIGSGTKEEQNVNVDNQINSGFKGRSNSVDVEQSTHLQGLSSKPAKTITSLAMKRRKECPTPLPWHIAIAQPASSIRTTSDAELQWAATVNRLPEKGDEGVDPRDTNVQFAYRAKQRLRLTTQLMQTIVAPAPATLMQSTTVEGRESGTFTLAKLMLEEVCRLAEGRRRQNDSPSRTDISNGCNVTDLATKQQKPLTGTNFISEAAAKLTDQFKDRIKKLDNRLSRLENLPSSSEIVTEVQRLDKLSITNRLVDRYFDEFAIEETDSLSGGKAAFMVSHGTHKVFPRRYVTAVPMPSKLPDGTQLISL
ncbi:hypothetical protein O6H91_17G014400 [Diphasiastrum complanatum]|uniref:Uncharacterized protein n=1 Tax=Diphasiastrum complanatum TaxID=34168 RepID=A0ACC2B4A4_DIPCM|nr:hypothetical protein O6H91_17G014400 [Diphasiastrum complanatum]